MTDHDDARIVDQLRVREPALRVWAREADAEAERLGHELHRGGDVFVEEVRREARRRECTCVALSRAHGARLHVSAAAIAPLENTRAAPSSARTRARVDRDP